MRIRSSSQILLALLATLACCTGSGKSKSSRTPGSGSDATATVSGADVPASRDYSIHASDYAFRDLPVRAPSGWLTLRLVNTGKETHMLAIAPVPSGFTTSGFVDSLVHLHLAPNTTFVPGVDVVSPGDTAVTTAFFPAGAYAVACFVKSADGAFHVMKGMAGWFDVVPARDTGVAPTAVSVVTMTGNHIGLDGAALTSGVHTLRIVSSNPHPQDFQILELLPGRSATDALTWFGNRTTLAPAAEAVGGVSSIHSGQRASVTVNFTPGVYLLFYAVDEADPHPVFVQRTVTIPAPPGAPLATTRQRATR